MNKKYCLQIHLGSNFLVKLDICTFVNNLPYVKEIIIIGTIYAFCHQNGGYL